MTHQIRIATEEFALCAALGGCCATGVVPTEGDHREGRVPAPFVSLRGASQSTGEDVRGGEAGQRVVGESAGGEFWIFKIISAGVLLENVGYNRRIDSKNND